MGGIEGVLPRCYYIQDRLVGKIQGLGALKAFDSQKVWCEMPARMIETRDSHELLAVAGMIPHRTANRHATRPESRSERARSCSTHPAMSPNPIGRPTRRLPARMEVIGNPTPRDPPTIATEKHVNVVGMITFPRGRCMCRL